MLLWNQLGTLASGSEMCGYIHHLQAIYNLKGEISVFICEYEMSTQHHSGFGDGFRVLVFKKQQETQNYSYQEN